MQSHTLGGKPRFKPVVLLSTLLLAAVILLVWWASGPLRFLQGHRGKPVLRHATVYALPGDLDAINRMASAELKSRGFVQDFDERGPDGKTVGYSLPQRVKEVRLVERSETPGTVEVWIEPQPGFLETLGLRYAHSYSCVNSCIANLKQIEGAKENWALEERKTANDVPREADLFGPSRYIQEKPTCWRGGLYIFGAVGKPPRCSIPGHSLP